MKSLAILTMLLSAIVFVVRGVEAAPEVELKLNHMWIATQAVSRVDQRFADEVAKRTEGRVRIKIFWSQALGKAAESLALMQKGAIDMAAVSPAFTASELPFLNALNGLPVLPIAMKDPYHALLTANTVMEKVPAFKDETRAHNFRLLYFHTLNPYYLFSRKPIEKFADLKGLKFRSFGTDLADVMKAAGAVPVTVFVPEVYENIQRGVIDGGAIGLEEILTYKLYEVGKYVTTVKMWQGITTPVMMNLDRWNAISPQDQQVILDIAREVQKMELAIYDEAIKKDREAVKAKGVRVIEFPETELRQWIAASPDLHERWVQRMKAIGKEADARKTVEIWKELNR